MKHKWLKALSIFACLLPTFCLVSCGTIKYLHDKNEEINDMNEKLSNLKSEIAELEKQLDDQLSSSLEYYQTESYLQDLYKDLLELEGKK